MTAMAETPQGRNWWPFGIAAGLGVVIAVNVAVVIVAQNNAPVMVSDDYYDEALHYDKVMEVKRKSAALGFRAQAGACSTWAPGEPCLVHYTLVNGIGEPVTGLAGKVTLRRADSNQWDVSAETRETAPGRYEARVALKRAGLYTLSARLDGAASPWLDERSVSIEGGR